MAKHLFLHTWEWFEGPNTVPGPHWRPPGGHAVVSAALDLRTMEQRGTPGGEGGPGLFESEDDALGGLYLGVGLDATLSQRQRAEVRARLGLRELPSANVRELVGHIFTQYSDPTGRTMPKPVRAARRRPVRLTFAGEDVFSEPFAGLHVDRALAVFQDDYVRAKAEMPAWLEQVDASRVRTGAQALDAELRAAVAAYYAAQLEKWVGFEALQAFGAITPENVRAILPAGHKNDRARDPATTVNETWPNPDGTLNSQDQTWTAIIIALGAHTATVGGVGRNFLWTTTGSTYGAGRCETAVSSDDHYTEAYLAFLATPDENKLVGPSTRAAAAADTMYVGASFKSGTDNAFIIQRVTGTNTFQASAASTAPVLSDSSNDNRVLWRMKSDGSLHNLYRAGVAQIVDHSDTGITGNLRGGALFYDNVTACCAVGAFTVADLLSLSPPTDLALTPNTLTWNDAAGGNDVRIYRSEMIRTPDKLRK